MWSPRPVTHLFFNVVGPRLWNELPIAIKRIDTVPLFIKALKKHIFKEEFC